MDERGPGADHVRGGRRVVGDDIGEAETEVPVPGVDDLQCGSHRRDDLAQRAVGVGAVDVGAQQIRDLGLDARVDGGSPVERRSVVEAHRIGEAADDDVMHAHLLRLRLAREPELEAREALAAGDPTGDQCMLRGVRGVEIDLCGCGELADRGRGALRGVERGGEHRVRGHAVTPERVATRSSATSTIMSSWPPTMRRRPSSTRMSRASRPCFSAARSACSRKLEYTPA